MDTTLKILNGEAVACLYNVMVMCVWWKQVWQKRMRWNQSGNLVVSIHLITEAQRHPLVGQFAEALVLALQ